MNDLEIIQVENANDLATCLNIRNSVFTKEQGVPKEFEVDEYDTLNHKCIHFLMKYKNIYVGTLRGLFQENNTIKLQRFCFLKEYRNLGMGKKTLQYIENYYKNCGKTLIKLDAQYQVYKFYEKCGYSKNSEIFTEANIKHIEMIKRL